MAKEKNRYPVLLVNFSSRGGLAHHIYFLCNALAKTSVDFVLLTTRDFELSEQCKHFLCKKKLFSHIEYKSTLLKGLIYCASLFMVFLNVRRLKPKILHLQETRILLAEKWLLSLAKKQGVKIVFTAHDIVNTDLEKMNNSADLKTLYQLFDFVIAHTEGNRQTIIREFAISPKKVAVLPVGEYTNLANGHLDQKDARKLLGIEQNRDVVLFFGYIRKYKGLNLLLKALLQTRAENPEVFLIIAGEPKENMRLYHEFIDKHNLQKYVLFDIRYIPMEKMSAYFAAADVVALPYLRVFQSGLVKLAFAYKRPAIATRVGDLPTAVEHGKTGFLVQPNSADELADALKKAFENRDRLSKMGENGFRKMQEKFSWRQIADEMEKIYAVVFSNRQQ